MVTHQTVRLSAGRHDGPEDGMCVVELASLLAGAPFSDRPEGVSPSVAAFLRGYNDNLDDRRRRDLYELASALVDSAATERVEAQRVERLRAWALPLYRRRLAWWPQFGYPDELVQMEALGSRCARIARSPRKSWLHGATIALLLELLATEGTRPRPQSPASRAEVVLTA